jgi:nicotinamidase-related amidase
MATPTELTEPKDLKTALLIIDMQNTFLSMTSTALPHIIRLASFFRTLHLPIICTQHGHSAAELTPPLTNQLVRKWGVSGSIATGSKGWELIPEIQILIDNDASIPIISKNTYDAFLNTTLEKELRERAVERVVVCGVMTDCCVDTTARGAFNRGYETWVLSDATGSANDVQHERGLAAFAFAFGQVLGTDEVIKRLG